jgi:hypothetical protein
MTANPHRGEQSIELAGATYVLRPTFEAAVAIEEQLGGLLGLLTRLLNDRTALTLKEAAVIVCECMKAGGQAANQDKVKRLLFEAGYYTAAPQVLELLTAMVTGGIEQKPAASPGNG